MSLTDIGGMDGMSGIGTMGSIDMTSYTSPSRLMRGDRSSGGFRFSPMPRGPGVRSHTSSRTGSSHSELYRPQLTYHGHPRHNPAPRADDVPCPDGYFHDKSEWINPLCHEPSDDMDTCCLGCWCPQVLYGRTQYRLKQIAENKDPLDLKDYKPVNKSCTSFLILGTITSFDWTFVMLQHTRIRTIYNIEGTRADDVCSAYVCPNCTLMQDDREIRAREEQRKEEMKKNAATVHHQPKPKAGMQYATPQRGSLLRESITASVAVGNQDCNASCAKSEKAHDSGHPRHHTKPHDSPKLGVEEDIANAKGKNASSDGISGPSHTGNTRGKTPSTMGSAPNLINRNATLEITERDAIVASRQAWRRLGSPENILSTLADTYRRALVDFSENASISQVGGKRLLKQLTEAKGRVERSAATNSSDNPADEPVLVFYDDRDQPQRHRLADCARLRASTLSRPNTLRQNDLPGGWRNHENVIENSQPENAKPSGLGKSPHVHMPEFPMDVNPQRALDDCLVEDTTNAANDQQKLSASYDHDDPIDNTGGAADAKQPRGSSLNSNNVADTKQHRSLLHSASNSAGESVTTANKVDIPTTPLGQIQQHSLEDCPIDNTTTANPASAPGISQHHLAECTEIESEIQPITSSTLVQHWINDGPINVNLPSESSRVDQHEIADCVTISDAQSSKTSNPDSSNTVIQSREGPVCPICDDAAKQKEGHTAATTSHDGTADAESEDRPNRTATALRDVLDTAADERQDRKFRGGDRDLCGVDLSA